MNENDESPTPNGALMGAEGPSDGEPKGDVKNLVKRRRLGRRKNIIRLGSEDGRTARNKLYQRTVAALATDAGGWRELTEAGRILVQQIAQLSMQITELQDRMLKDGASVGQTEALSRLCGTRRRALVELRAAAPAPHRMTVGEYIQKKYGND